MEQAHGDAADIPPVDTSAAGIPDAGTPAAEGAGGRSSPGGLPTPGRPPDEPPFPPVPGVPPVAPVAPVPTVPVGPPVSLPPGAPVAGLAALRRRYARGELDEADVAPDPLTQFAAWLDEALAGQVAEPNAMVLATATSDGVPSARTVLLKGLDERGFVFYTNYESAKAADLDANPRAALVFPWHAMERQVRVTGTAERVSREESAAYFASRPRDSKLGAWASPQSQVVADRATLDRAYAELEARWGEDEEIPLPDFWGGYRVRPERVEFWQGRHGRLHDRIGYRREDAGWVIERLAP